MKKIADIIGLPALLEQTAEECAELAQACLKYSRKLRGVNPTPKTIPEINESLEEELADVTVCLNELKEKGFCANQTIISSKTERWHRRLQETEEDKNG